MEDADPEIADAVRRFAAQARPGPHPLPEDLLAYHEGQLSARENEAIRDHLEACEHCSNLALGFAGFPGVEPGSPAEQLSDGEIGRRLAALRARLREEGGGASSPAAEPRSPVLRPPAAPDRRWPRWGRWPQLVAAGLLAAALGLAVWGVTLHRRLAELSRPAGRVAVSDLVPLAMTGERATEASEPTEVPAWADRVLLVLNLFEPRTYSAYQVEIFRGAAGGPALWSSRDLHRSPDGSFALEVPRDFLPPGAYRIELSGLDDGRRDRLAVYQLLLKFQPF